MLGILQRHPRRCRGKHARQIRRVPRPIVVDHSNTAHLARLPLLADPQQYASGHKVGRHQIDSPEESAQETGHLGERLMTKLVLAQAAEDPSEATHPQSRDFPMQSGLGGSRSPFGCDSLWPVFGRTHGIKDYRHAENDQREDDPVEEDDHWRRGNCRLIFYSYIQMATILLANRSRQHKLPLAASEQLTIRLLHK